MKELLVAYMPYKVHVHRIWTDLAQPWVVGYHRNVFLREFWQLHRHRPGREGAPERLSRRREESNHADLAKNVCAGAAWAPWRRLGRGRRRRRWRRRRAGSKVLRYAFEVAETSLDPARVNDLYSRTLTPHIYEGSTPTTTWRGRSSSSR